MVIKALGHQQRYQPYETIEAIIKWVFDDSAVSGGERLSSCASGVCTGMSSCVDY